MFQYQPLLVIPGFNRVGEAFLYLFGNIIALETTCADFKGNGGSPEFCLYLDQVGFPGSAGTIFGMTDLVTRNRVFSANIASP